MVKKKSIFNWSGGKDSCIALYRILQRQEFSVKTLYTSVNSSDDRITMHGVRLEFIKMQADRIGIPLKILRLPEQPSMKVYNERMIQGLKRFKRSGYTHSIFGDIHLEDLRQYREVLHHKSGIMTVFPIWNESTKSLINRFIDDGFKAITVCVKADTLGEEFVGRLIDHEFIKDLPNKVDPCGENGEFHTFVFDGPIFSKPIDFKAGNIIFRDYNKPIQSDDERSRSTENDPGKMGFWFCDLEPIQS